MSPRVLKHTPLEVVIHLPSAWEHEAEDSNTDVFWNEDEEGGGTLRIAVLVYNPETTPTDEDLLACVTSEEASPPEKLAKGGYLSTEEDTSEEDDVSIHNWLWTIAKSVVDNRVAVIVGTYTADSDLKDSPPVRTELEIIQQSIREIEVSTR